MVGIDLDPYGIPDGPHGNSGPGGPMLGAPPPTPVAFGDALRYLRRRAGLSMSALAAATGVSTSTIGATEAAYRPGTVELARACDKALGTGPLLEHMLTEPHTRPAVPARVDTGHPEWCDPQQCTAAEPVPGEHRSAPARLRLDDRGIVTAVVHLEQSAAVPSGPVLVVAFHDTDSGHEDGVGYMLALPVDQARALAHMLRTAAGQVDRR